MTVTVKANSVALASITTATRDGLSASAGELVYNSDNGTTEFYTGATWKETGAGTGKAIAMAMIFL